MSYTSPANLTVMPSTTIALRVSAARQQMKAAKEIFVDAHQKSRIATFSQARNEVLSLASRMRAANGFAYSAIGLEHNALSCQVLTPKQERWHAIKQQTFVAASLGLSLLSAAVGLGGRIATFVSGAVDVGSAFTGGRIAHTANKAQNIASELRSKSQMYLSRSNLSHADGVRVKRYYEMSALAGKMARQSGAF